MVKRNRKTERNETACALFTLDPKKYSAPILAKKYKISRQTMHEIIVREMARRGDKKAKSLAVVRVKYKALSLGN